MAQDTVDASAFACAPSKKLKKVPSIEALNSEMPGKENQRDRRMKLFKSLLNRLRLKKCASATISKPDPTYRVVYLGNVVTGWAKGEGCLEKPLSTLWRNYCSSTTRAEVSMRVTVGACGLRAATRDHGVTEYWAHRLTTCAAPESYPRLFAWVYRHEGRKLRHDLRCHAVLCPSLSMAKKLEEELKSALALALAEFKRDKIHRQNARLSLVNSVYDNPTMPRRKILLSTGSQNYRPPLERSKSAPKLTAIEEIIEEEDIFVHSHQIFKQILQHCDSSNSLLDKRKSYILSKIQNSHLVPVHSDDRKHNKENRVKFTDEAEQLTEASDLSSPMSTEVKSPEDLILDELVQHSLSDDLLESCERAWLSIGSGLTRPSHLQLADGDDGSLSSGCESAASTAMSEESPTAFPTVEELNEEDETKPTTKTDFKVGDCVLSRSFERLQNSDIFNMYSNKAILPFDEVSLVPVGESQTDFSSLKVYKKRSMSEGKKEMLLYDLQHGDGADDEETKSACSDESGYEEEMVSTVANIVLV